MGVGIAGNNVTYSIYSTKNQSSVSGGGTVALFTMPANSYAEMQIYSNTGAGKIEASDTLLQIVASTGTGRYLIATNGGCTVQSVGVVTVGYSVVVYHNS